MAIRTAFPETFPAPGTGLIVPSPTTPILLSSPQMRHWADSLVDMVTDGVMAATLGDDALDLAGAPALLVLADLRDHATVDAVRRVMPPSGLRPPLAFIIPRDCHLCHVQAAALGADIILAAEDTKATKAWLRSQQSRRAVHHETGGPDRSPGPGPAHPANQALLRSILVPAATGHAPDAVSIRSAVSSVQADIEQAGLDRWLDAVRHHHSGTYQHCLIVTGVAIRFALALGLGRSDVERIGLAAALHDIGKASIPLEILDKPGRLDPDELALIRSHPRLGFERLSGAPGLAPDIVQAVLRHHEFLDGSGYPDGLMASDLGDMTRIITIADVYGALIEKRSYKPPLSDAEAYGIVSSMAAEGKLEKALVRAFGQLTRTSG